MMNPQGRPGRPEFFDAVFIFDVHIHDRLLLLES